MISEVRRGYRAELNRDQGLIFRPRFNNTAWAKARDERQTATGFARVFEIRKVANYLRDLPELALGFGEDPMLKRIRIVLISVGFVEALFPRNRVE